MPRYFAILLVLILGTTLTFPLYANADKRMDRIMKRLDQNSDGKISRAEAVKRREQAFSRVDKDKDNQLTLEEFKNSESRSERHNADKHFKHLDKDKDQLISRSEFTAKLPLFDRADKNKDGTVTKDELQTFLKK